MIADQKGSAFRRYVFDAPGFDLEIIFEKKTKNRFPSGKSSEVKAELVFILGITLIERRVSPGKNVQGIGC